MSRLDYEKDRRRRATHVGGASYTNDAARRVIYLNVPFEAKGAAKALGARWDAQEKRWFCLDGTAAASALLAGFRMAHPKKRKVEKRADDGFAAVSAAFAAFAASWGGCLCLCDRMHNEAAFGGSAK
jgi:hypothetical protein